MTSEQVAGFGHYSRYNMGSCRAQGVLIEELLMHDGPHARLSDMDMAIARHYANDSTTRRPKLRAVGADWRGAGPGRRDIPEAVRGPIRSILEASTRVGGAETL